MPFNRPPITTLQQRTASDFELAGLDPEVANAVVDGVRQALVGVSHGLHGHLDAQAKNYHPGTAKGEDLERHATWWGVGLLPATASGGNAVFSGGIDGSPIPVDTVMVRDDGAEFVVGAEVTISGGSATVALTAVKAGVDGNTDAGTTLSLVETLEGVPSQATVDGNGLTGGTEIEEEEAQRARLNRRVQNPIHGGSLTDYVTWALEFPGVTRAWAYGNEMGAGTVTVRFMMDDTYADGIPLAANATALFDYIEPLRPAGMSGLFVVPPIATPLNPIIKLSPNTTLVQAAVQAELEDLIRRVQPEDGTGKGTLKISHIREAVSLAAGEKDHEIVSPAANVTLGDGEITTLGTPTWQAL